jgi:hypothetical protein
MNCYWMLEVLGLSAQLAGEVLLLLLLLLTAGPSAACCGCC